MRLLLIPGIVEVSLALLTIVVGRSGMLGLHADKCAQGRVKVNTGMKAGTHAWCLTMASHMLTHPMTGGSVRQRQRRCASCM